uniref:Uncharacterized protein n=1 Tax=Arundo donax TaxID=35708 RepID=A0A0A9B9Q6_ARUDO
MSMVVSKLTAPRVKSLPSHITPI